MSEHAPPEPPLSSRLGFVGRVDDAVYRVEIVIVVAALVMMSIIVFADVAYQLAVGVSQYLDDSDPRGMGVLSAVLGFIGLIAFAATGDARVRDEEEPEPLPEARPLPLRIAITVAVVVGTLGVGWALLALESATVFRVLLITLAIPIARSILRHGDSKRLGVFVAAMALAFSLFGSLPSGYSWSQSYSLVMLLWVGFLGASIAARERRHLKVDLARKLLPPDKVPWFNCVSYLVAALFSGLVLYLGVEYIFGHDSTYIRPVWDLPTWLPESLRTMLVEDFPLAEDASLWRRFLQVAFVPSEPGELPDWLKVAAIPVSMLLVTLRFLGHCVVFGRMALAGEAFHEVGGTH